VLARWLAIDPKMLILDEPTRGIDVAAKFEIMDRVMQLCAKGRGILLISSEIAEVLRVSDRIAVMRDRRKVADLSGDELDEHAVYRLIAGGQA
jgi:galactofuranose transport system ATP-binding protein